MKNLTVFLFLLLTCSFAFSQSDKHTGNSSTEITSSHVQDPQVTEAVKNLKIARINENAEAVKHWQNRLHQLTKPQIIHSSENSLIYNKEMIEVSNPLEVLNVTRITNGVVIANSVSRERVNGHIYAVIGFYGGPATSDTLRVYRSTNNGIGFTQILSLYDAGNFKIDYNGLDVEAMGKGDSSYAFLTMTYSLAGNSVTGVIRVRSDGGLLGSVTLSGGGINTYKNTRITSDNAAFTGFSYVYVSTTLDSNASGASNIKSKFFRIENPFDFEMTGTMGYQNAASGQYGYYIAGAAPLLARFESDLAYVNTLTGQDHIYTVTVVRGVSGLFGEGSAYYFTRSTDFGATAPALFNTPSDVPYTRENPRIASTGYLNNSVMVTSRRLSTNGDWDAFYSYCPDITAPFFTNGFAGSTNDTTTSVSVAALYCSNGSYLFAYNNKIGENASNVFIRPFTSGSLGSNVQVNPPGLFGTNFYGYAEPTFRNVNNDSCFVIWGGAVGIGSYVTGGCSGPVTHIGHSNTGVNDFHISQNYPNPFNPSTKISYKLPYNSKVLIKVFDVVGKEVAVIVNETQNAGAHSIDFNGVNLVSGVYYYRIEANDFSETKKMILIK